LRVQQFPLMTFPHLFLNIYEKRATSSEAVAEN